MATAWCWGDDRKKARDLAVVDAVYAAGGNEILLLAWEEMLEEERQRLTEAEQKRAEALLRTQVDFFDDGSLRMIANNVETHVVQRAFRQVLDAFARPGTVGQVDAFPESGEIAPVPGCFETAIRLLLIKR